MSNVVLKDITKVYQGGFKAVHKANFEIKDKEFVVLVGPSGCGKSTTLRMIAGLEDISEGEIYIADKLVNDVSPKNRDIAMVFQNYALYPHMSVYENMAFGLKIQKVPKDEIDKRVQEAAKILHIENQLQKKPSMLSGGQKQRVAMGRAIVRKPKVFLFDEPLSNLDAKLRVTMRTEIARLHTKLQTTIVYVTHDQVEAMTLGDRIVVMKDGYIQQIDSPLNIYNNPINKFVAGFIGSPPMNFLTIKVKKSGNEVNIEHEDIKLIPNHKQQSALKSYADKEVTFGFRPEDLTTKPEKGDNKIKAVIDVIEPLGSEIFLYLSTADGTQIEASSPPQLIFKVGDEIELGVMIDRCHFFETTGNEEKII